MVSQYEMVKKVLWDNQALGVGIFKIVPKTHN